MTKKKFEDIRNRIIINLQKNNHTKMELAKLLKSEYRTIERHLIWLLGTEKIRKMELLYDL